MSGNITKSSPFLTVEFITLNLIMLLAFTNLAVFFDFYGYLKELNIPTEWCGLLVGLVSATALVLRPFISMVLTPKNAIAGIATGLLLAALSLLLYEHARTVTQFVLLRVVHGTAWVFLGSSLIVLLVASLPLARSGQGFSIITIMTLLPYAIVPLVIDNFLGQLSQGQLYRYTAFLIKGSSPLLAFYDRFG